MAKKLATEEVPAKFLKKASANRIEGTRDVKAFFLIVCEGKETEPNYFKSFPKRNKSYVIELKTGGGGISTRKVVEKAVKSRDASPLKFDRVWAVFDKDSFTDDNFDKAIDLAQKNQIRCAWSNEAFELWYLLHFSYVQTAMHRNDYTSALERAVNNQLRKKGKRMKFTYTKNSKTIYDLLNEIGDQKQAILWAKQLESKNAQLNCSKRNPCTLVYKLVDELNGSSQELVDEIKEKLKSGS